MRNSKIIDVFLSSPEDVYDERQFVIKTAKEWNSLRSKTTGYHVNVLIWEDIVAPILSDRSQSAVKEQIGEEYDVYLGMMWGRFGSPTGVADSGTVEEFEDALKRYKSGDAVRLAMLFKTNDIPQSDLIGEQFDKVKLFKKRYADEGGFYGEFDNEDRLRSLLNRIFEQIVSTRNEEGGSSEPSGLSDYAGSSLASTSQIAEDASTNLTAASCGDDLGLVEVNERLEFVANHQTVFFEGYTKVSNNANAEIEAATSELQDLMTLGQADPKKVKRPIGRISTVMNKSAAYLEDNLSEFKSYNNELVTLTEQGLDVAGDFHDNSNRADLKEAVSGVIQTLLENRLATEELIKTVEGLPRVTTEMGRARNRLISTQRELRNELFKVHNELSEIVARY